MSLPAAMVSDKAKCIHNNITELPEQLFILLLGYSRLVSCTISGINPLGHSMVVIITPLPHSLENLDVRLVYTDVP